MINSKRGEDSPKLTDNAELEVEFFSDRDEGEPFVEENSVESLGVFEKDAEAELSALVGDATDLEESIIADTSLSTVDKKALLQQCTDMLSDIQLWGVKFLEKVREISYDLKRKPGDLQYADRLLEVEVDETASPSSMREHLGVFSKRLDYIRKKKLFPRDVVYTMTKKNSDKNKEAKTAWNSAWKHLARAAENFERIKGEGSPESIKKMEDENIEAARLFFERIFEENFSVQEVMIFGIEEGEEIPDDFYSTMSETVQRGFHKAFLERLKPGVARKYGEPREYSSVDVVPYRRSKKLTHSYTNYLDKSFRLGEMLEVLDAVSTQDREVKLLEESAGTYGAVGRQGLEDIVANMAIHRAALETAGVSTDQWYGNDTDQLEDIRKKTGDDLPVFLENLYGSLEGHPAAIIQAFKGLLKLPTEYYAPAGSYKYWAGYNIYSEEDGKFVCSFDNTYGGFNSFDEWSKQMKGYVFDISSVEDINVLLYFVMEKGKTNQSMNTLGMLFVDLLREAAERQGSEAAEIIDSGLEGEDLDSLRRYSAIFPGKPSDGGVFFNKYLESIERDGVDILDQVDVGLISVVYKKCPEVKRDVFDFANDHYGFDNASELIVEHIQNVCRFVQDVGFMHREAFRVITQEFGASDEAFSILSKLSELPEDMESRVKIRILDTFSEWLGLSEEKRQDYVKVLVLLDQAPSQEIQRIAKELVGAIIDSDDPLDSWRQIEDVFIKNNLPLVGKIHKIFKILHPPEKMDEVLEAGPTLSPYLQRASPKRREYTIFSDLLRVHIDSGNRSLRQYLEILQEGEMFFDDLENLTDANEGVSAIDQRRLHSFVKKLNTVFSESQLGFVSLDMTSDEDPTIEQIQALYASLRESLSVEAGQSISDRVVDMFASRLGYKSIGEVLVAMKDKKQDANERGLHYANGAKEGQLSFVAGDILKGVGEQYIASILQNGSVAKEYLGSASDQDYTPYDTDVEVLKPVAGQSFSETLSSSMATGYGNILFVVRDRGQFVETSSETEGKIDPRKLELFKTGFVSEGHYGIRTGFASTEIDFMIYNGTSTEMIRSLSLEIVQNGYYIPVVDKSGKIIFTPDQYDSLREFYSGLDRFDGPEFAYAQTGKGQKHSEDVEFAKKEIDETMERINEMTQSIQHAVAGVLLEHGVHLKDGFDTSILGAELLDTGSTGRNTNLSDSFDFDLALKLDLSDESKFGGISEALKALWNPEKDNSHPGGMQGDIYQLRFEGAQMGGELVDIDIAFVRKSELVVYGSHDAVKERLGWIQENIGDDAHKDVLANVVVAKKVLKEGSAYKKVEHGGMGGIGVENWILAHGGNFENAAKAFWQAARDEEGVQLSIYDFQKKYQVIDPGINVKFQAHDNFVKMLNEDGYNNMCKVIGEYFGWG